MDTLIILLILVVGVVAIVLTRTLRHSRRINGYFVNAVKAYVWLDEEDAKVAALAASKVVAGKQRDSMLNYLKALTSDFKMLLPANPEFEPFINRLSELQAEIGTKDWTVKDVIDEKQRLGDCNPAYLKALEKADADVFVRKYPGLFSASNILETIGAAEKEKRKEVENLVYLGEQLLKLKESQDPKIRKLIEDGIKQGEKDLENQ